jgi:O-antigen/teichoic acid export membrane protein
LEPTKSNSPLNHMVSRIRWILKGEGTVSATLQTLLARVAMLVIGVATGVITARLLGPEGRGEQAAISMWGSFLSYLLTLGLPSALIYSFKRYPKEQSNLFSSAVVMSGILGIIACLIGIVGLPHWLTKYPPDAVRVAQWLMLGAPLNSVSTVMCATLEARGEFRTANHVRYLPLLATLLLLLPLAALHKLTPITAAIAYFIPSIAVFIGLFIYLSKIFQLSFKNLTTSCKQLLSYGIRSYGFDLLGTLSGQIDQVLVIGLLKPSAMGMYVVALSISRLINVFQSAIVTVLFPRIAACPLPEVLEITGRTVRLSAAVTILSGCMLSLCGADLLRIFYGAKFLESVIVFRILLLEIIIAGITWGLMQAFMALGKPGIVTITQGIGLGASIPLMLFLIPKYGLNGAGFALLCSTLLRFVFIMVSFPLVLRVPPPSLFFKLQDWQYARKILSAKT